MSGRIQKLGVAVGKKGVGKTYKTTEIIRQYVLGNPARGVPGRKVLIMDINNEFEGFRAIDPRHVRLFSASPTPEARRIRPMHPETGKQMSLDEFATVLFKVLGDFRGGMLILEDINKYISDSMPNDLIGLICTNRHIDVDVMIHYQSLSRLQTKVWQNVNYIRYHQNTDSVDRSIKKFPDKYELLKLAELLVEKEYQTNKRFCLYVDVDDEKIFPCSPFPITSEMKLEAIAALMKINEKPVRDLLKERDNGNKAVYDLTKARKSVQDRMLRQYF